MASIVLKQQTNEKHLITLEQEGARITVSACPIIDNATCGYPVAYMYYNHKDKKNAQATFNRYCKNINKYN